jgi:anthranilate synthase component II
MRLLLIDNYDSFTYNLVHYFAELGAVVEVRRNDALSVADALEYPAIVLSPGPCAPDSAGICLALLDAIKTTPRPLLGVCLGHQAIGQAFGGQVVRAPTPVHGKVWDVLHDGTGLFEDLPNPLPSTRYHSLIVDAATLPDCLIANAHTNDGLIMAMHHKTLPIYGVQFHPESIASTGGHHLLQNFLKLAPPTLLTLNTFKESADFQGLK